VNKISFTVDLEDPSERYAPQGRYVAMTRRLLALCDELDCRATFFTVGLLARAAPDLVKAIAAQGHEIAYHSHAHVSLTRQDLQSFRAETSADKDFIEQLIGKPVLGFRAPRFSLTPQSVWATAVLADMGFRYSSSVMPTGLSRFGFAATPRTPFLWPSGLLELPLPVAACGPLAIPYLGGIYLYAMPALLTRRWLNAAPPESLLWTYTHPYDFDVTERFAPMPHTPLWVSLVLWLARRRAEPQLRRVLTGRAATTLGERAAQLSREQLPRYRADIVGMTIPLERQML